MEPEDHGPTPCCSCKINHNTETSIRKSMPVTSSNTKLTANNARFTTSSLERDKTKESVTIEVKDSTKDTLSTIKDAIGGFLGRFYCVTKSTACLIATESAKHLGILKKSDSQESIKHSADTEDNLPLKIDKKKISDLKLHKVDSQCKLDDNKIKSISNLEEKIAKQSTGKENQNKNPSETVQKISKKIEDDIVWEPWVPESVIKKDKFIKSNILKDMFCYKDDSNNGSDNSPKAKPIFSQLLGSVSSTISQVMISNKYPEPDSPIPIKSSESVKRTSSDGNIIIKSLDATWAGFKSGMEKITDQIKESPSPRTYASHFFENVDSAFTTIRGTISTGLESVTNEEEYSLFSKDENDLQSDNEEKNVPQNRFFRDIFKVDMNDKSSAYDKPVSTKGVSLDFGNLENKTFFSNLTNRVLSYFDENSRLPEAFDDTLKERTSNTTLKGEEFQDDEILD